MKDKTLSHTIIGCAMRVHSAIGCGFQERAYQMALAVEFREQGLNFVQEQNMPVMYKRVHLCNRRVDFFVADKVIVELKATMDTQDIHKVQTANYCKMYGLPYGLLINFGGVSLDYRRVYNFTHPDNAVYHRKYLENKKRG